MSYSVEQRKLEVRRYLEAVWKSPQDSERGALSSAQRDREPAALSPQAAQDFLPYHINMRQVLQKSLSDLHFTLLEMLAAEEETIIARWLVEGTDLGGYEGHLPTGRPVALTGITLIRMEGPNVVEEYSETNLAELQRQLGFVALPTPKITLRRPRSSYPPW